MSGRDEMEETMWVVKLGNGSGLTKEMQRPRTNPWAKAEQQIMPL